MDFAWVGAWNRCYCLEALRNELKKGGSTAALRLPVHGLPASSEVAVVSQE
jgi:hypothetical protein